MLPPILPLALALQTATLAADPHQAALTCTASMSKTPDGRTVLQRSATASYLLVQAALANPNGGGFFSRLEAIAAESAAVPRLSDAEAAALLAQCTARFPRARHDGAVALPADPVERDVTCMSALSTIGGSAQAIGAEAQADSARYSAASDVYGARISAGLASKGYPGEDAAEAFIGGVVTASLKLGNSWAIANACIAALPPA